MRESLAVINYLIKINHITVIDPVQQKQVKSKIRPRYYLPISLFTRSAYDALIAVHATQNRIIQRRQNNRIKISIFLFPGLTRGKCARRTNGQNGKRTRIHRVLAKPLQSSSIIDPSLRAR